METKTYAKLAFATSAASLAIIGSIFGIWPVQEFFKAEHKTIEPESEREWAMLDVLYRLSSVHAFKETYPDYREEYENRGHEIQYHIQARNNNTGNVYSLQAEYHAYHNDMIVEFTNCRLVDAGMNDNNVPDTFYHDFDAKNLFLDSTIRDSNCLDDDYYEKHPVQVRSE